MPLRINIPPLTRALLVFLIGFSLIYQAASYRSSQAQDSTQTGSNSTPSTFSTNPVPWIALTPQLSMFYPWVLVTSTLAEQNFLTILIAGATIFYGGKYLERAWGSRDFGIFILVITAIPNFAAALLYVFAFALTRADSTAYVVIQGSIPIQAAFLVAFKQLVPEHTVTILKGLIKIRVKHFPAIFLTANTLSGFVFSTDTAAVLSWLGFLTSWTYLRFYKYQPDLSGASTGSASSSSGSTALRGDASETFAFAYFWPDVVHGPVEALANAVFRVLVALKLCTPFSAEDVESSNQQASARGGEGLPSIMQPGRKAGGGGNGGKREEAERRRVLALKALDQRLQAAAARPAQDAVPTTSAPEPTKGPERDAEAMA